MMELRERTGLMLSMGQYGEDRVHTSAGSLATSVSNTVRHVLKKLVIVAQVRSGSE